MKNKLSDMNNILFEQLERLNDENITGEDLTAEIERSKALSGIASNIINNAKVQLDAAKVLLTHGGIDSRKSIPKIFELEQ